MKKIYLLLVVTIFSFQLFSQKDNSRYYNSWRLGLNVGGAWQTADYRSCWGMAGGLTLEKGLHENATNIFSFAIRARYLAANTYGMDYNRNYNIKNNYAYNGTYNSSVNYVDSVPLNRQYVYDNYKMKLGEGSLELQLTFNRLRERTGVILNVWGGIGITSYRTKSDLLDENGKRYNFSKIDSSGSHNSTLNSYNTLIDKKYESYALGSKSGNLITFSPSAGIGLGYQFSPVFSMLWEYKVTFPQGSNADLLDGKIGNNKDAIAGNNDYYHYTGLNLLFTLRGKHKTKTVKDETVYNNTPAPTNTVTPPTNTVVPVNPVNPVNPVVVNQPPAGQKPIISFITPPSNGYAVTNAQYKISAEIKNIESRNQIQFKFNGVNVFDFSFNAQSRILEYNSNLTKGNNSIEIIAKNNVGTDDKLVDIIYQLPKPVGNPPVVTINFPASCPMASSNQNYNIVSSVRNVSDKNNITVKIKNTVIYNFNFNPTTGQINVPMNLTSGDNDISISAVNDFGSDVKTCSITFAKRIQTVKAPVITITDPLQSGNISPSITYTVKAQVLNVSGSENISVTQNSTLVPFTFDNASNQLSIPVTFKAGTNAISIQASNSAGTDTKTTSIIYVEKKATGRPPLVNLVTPSQITSTTSVQTNAFKFLINNVAGNNDINVLVNGTAVTQFNYDVATKELNFTSNLLVGDNTIIVKGTNQFGMDIKTVNVNYIQPVVVKNPPVVAILSPQTIPYTTSNPIHTFKASVTNIQNKTGLVVKFNGNILMKYSYDGSSLSYNAPLRAGANTLEIVATNADGSDSKSASVNYEPIVVIPLPIVNLINPAEAENASSAANYNFKLSVLNVNSSADIFITHNNLAVNNFNYNSITKEVVFSLNLSVGENVIVVKATNSAGSDLKQIIVNYVQRVQMKFPPVITMINPSGDNTSVQSQGYQFKAKVTNVPDVSGLTVKLNGNQISNYNFSEEEFNYNGNLQLGENVFEISAVNNDGADSKAVTINYKERVLPKPPVIVITAPINTPTVNTTSYNFSFKAYNVSKDQLEVKVNEYPITQFNFANNIGSFTYDLTKDINTLSVKGTNTDGTVTKTANVVKVIHTDSVPVVPTSGGKMMTICHIPPGNNQNPQTITIPMSAWFEHQAHGDTQGECPANPTNIIVNPGRPKVIPEEKKNTETPQKEIENNNQPRRPR